MGTPKQSTETEIKISVASLTAVARRARQIGFRLKQRRTFESNALFDTPQSTLRGTGRLLRLRQSGERWILTFKGPAATGRHKSREELEIDVSDGASARVIFERLGYATGFRYEKYRTEYFDGEGTMTLDETPIGNYIELEGAPSWIDRTADGLGYCEADYITKSYWRLYLDRCQRDGLRPSNMTF